MNNHMLQEGICYRTWKDLRYARKNIIPSNSRPLKNNTFTSNCSIQSNILNNISSVNQHPITRYRSSRHPSCSRTKCNASYLDGNYIKPKPNPIKHWRKQLFPSQGTSTRSRNSITISQMERPGGRNTLNFRNENNIHQGNERNATGCTRFVQYENSSNQLQNLNNYGINNNNSPLCIDDYINTNYQVRRNCDYTKRNRIKKITSFTKDYHSHLIIN